ncbi:6-carboxytetrahydropterin synthase QueD [Archaeoglobus veneficus]|uniref:Queuosine biosynthesis protein QueD n=1 Tax=Archaeoglobus veneficus (strain DSM 11195 / SNP6) TaxID=693661 RepID=F2KSR7_ARCVS|nr:6-carboxytetrahydropterin synthase QueD [Archaeoglobus veneficus]AEA46962.1 queuosine biosynthesis protein QueD [Archaeoglobus veneficus SNP6]
MEVEIGVSETFDAAHFLPSHPKCGKTHGHTYRVEVTVRGRLKNGMVMDFAELKKIVREVIEKYDHNLINEFMENPTCENLCIAIFNEVASKLPAGVSLVRVRVYENPDKWAEAGNPEPDS